MVTTTISTILTEVIITKLNKKIAKSSPKDGNCHFLDIVLPIEKIDGVNIICELRIGVETNLVKTHLYQLQLCISIGTSKYDKKDDVFYKDMGMKSIKKSLKGPPCKQSEEYKRAVYDWISIKLTKIQTLITKLRVSPQRDCLTSKFEEESVLWEAKKAFCIEFEEKSSAPASIETTFKNCCVCDDETTHKTLCKHHICIVCISRLNKQRCPMCRCAIYDEGADDDSSSEEDSDEESDAEDDYIEDASEADASESDEDEEDAIEADASAVDNTNDSAAVSANANAIDAPSSLVSDSYNEY